MLRISGVSVSIGPVGILRNVSMEKIGRASCRERV